ncbi:uncharacterized protein LOC120423725 [Culex pipiens pallens]|uniref:uncharacterized protein LOC120423725 n=1 Tax=Culex pipiens pallens TaxID=42434 RepID=UPI0022AB368D|nr:uncharacterized protein LOC120423725 [Culex pipiens pallens]
MFVNIKISCSFKTCYEKQILLLFSICSRVNDEKLDKLDCGYQNSAITTTGLFAGAIFDQFSFKDPKKPKTEEGEGIGQVPMRKIIVVVQRMGDYVPSGLHGLLEHTLTIDHCTGDKWYMFRFFEKKKTPRPKTCSASSNRSFNRRKQYPLELVLTPIRELDKQIF